ncbi:MAG: DNA polymerase III subunit gamma/tau [Gallionella sp.]|nr:DNA polymerase III subunit gamma/tau [Gallionella sp.]
MSATTVLARKWRPRTFAELVGQSHVVRALENALLQNRLHHAYLFTGTRGVGKTTIARIFAKSLNCLEGVSATPCGECSACRDIDAGRFVDLVELDAASNTQVDSMRELLESALYAPTNARFKVYIIDEVHMLSRSAFNAMLKTLEEPPGHVKFILATTDPQKIPVTVLSRCLQFNLKQLPPALISDRLSHVLAQEQIEFEAPALALIARAAEGSMRDALSLLDQGIAFSAGRVTESIVRDMLGAVDRGHVFALMEALVEGKGESLLAIAQDMQMRSISFDAALQELAILLHRIALLKRIPQAIAEDDPDYERLSSLAETFAADELQLYYQIVLHGRNDLELAPDDYAGFTMTLLRMLAFQPARKVAEIPREKMLVSPRKIHAPEPVAETKSSAPVAMGVREPEVVPPVIPNGELPDWQTLVTQLNLQGIALQMAKQCVLQELSDNRITLQLAQEQKHFQSNKLAVEKLQTALTGYFARPIRLSVVIGGAALDTPAVLEQQARDSRQAHAEAALAQDDFVRTAQTEFDAGIVAGSVKPV